MEWKGGIGNMMLNMNMDNYFIEWQYAKFVAMICVGCCCLGGI